MFTRQNKTVPENNLGHNIKITAHHLLDEMRIAL